MSAFRLKSARNDVNVQGGSAGPRLGGPGAGQEFEFLTDGSESDSRGSIVVLEKEAPNLLLNLVYSR